MEFYLNWRNFASEVTQVISHPICFKSCPKSRQSKFFTEINVFAKSKNGYYLLMAAFSLIRINFDIFAVIKILKFLKNGPILVSFCLFSLFSRYNFNNTNWKKHRWYAWGSTRGRRMVGADETTELRRPPQNIEVWLRFLNVQDYLLKSPKKCQKIWLLLQKRHKHFKRRQFIEEHSTKPISLDKSHNLVTLYVRSAKGERSPVLARQATPITPHNFFTLVPVWPDWGIYWTLGNFSNPLSTINLPKSPTFLGNFC